MRRATLLALLAATCAHGSLLLPDGPGEPVLEMDTPAYGFARGFASQSAAPAIRFELSWCDDSCAGPPPSARPLLAGAILVQTERDTSACFHCGYARLAQMAQEAGALGLLQYSIETPGHETFVIHSRDLYNAMKHRRFPAAELGQGGRDALAARFASGRNASVVMRETNNVWDYYRGWPLALTQAISAVAALTVLVLGLRRLRNYWGAWRRYGMPVLILSIESVCNMQRLLYIVIDPLWARGILLYGPGRLLLTLCVPVGLLSCVLLFLTWNDMLRRKYAADAAVFRSKTSWISFLVISLVFVGLELTMTSLAAVGGHTSLTELSTLLLAAFSVLTGLLVFVSGGRLLRRLAEYQRIQEDAQRSQTEHLREQEALARAVIRTAAARSARTELELRDVNSNNNDGDDDAPPPQHEQGPEPVEHEPAGAAAATAQTTQTAQRTWSGRLLPRTLPRMLSSRALAQQHSARAQQIRRMTHRVRATAAMLVLSAGVIAAAGQDAPLFDPVARNALFLLFNLTQSARSYFTISFFRPKPTIAPTTPPQQRHT